MQTKITELQKIASELAEISLDDKALYSRINNPR